jgi:hypothetical protein
MIFKLPGIFWISFFDSYAKNVIMKTAVHSFFEVLFVLLLYEKTVTHMISKVFSHSFKKILFFQKCKE